MISSKWFSKLYKIKTLLKVCSSLKLALPVSISLTAGSHTDTSWKMSTLRNKLDFKIKKTTNVGKKGTPYLHRPTWILHLQDQARTQGLVQSILIHFLVQFMALSRCLDCILALECNHTRTQDMDWLELKVELMPAAVCSSYHSVCVCWSRSVTAVVHDCPLQTLPSYYKSKKTLTRRQKHCIFYNLSHRTNVCASHTHSCCNECGYTKPEHTLFRLIWGDVLCLVSSHLQSFSVCLWWHDLYIVLSPPPAPWPLNLSLSHASIFTPLACRKKRWKSLG